jgi:hypothetical protein
MSKSGIFWRLSRARSTNQTLSINIPWGVFSTLGNKNSDIRFKYRSKGEYFTPLEFLENFSRFANVQPQVAGMPYKSLHWTTRAKSYRGAGAPLYFSSASPASLLMNCGQARRLSKIVAGARASPFSQFIIRACISNW